jgi:hypothetical protein
MKKYATINKVVEAVKLDTGMIIGDAQGAPGDWLVVYGGRMSFMTDATFRDTFKEYRIQAPKSAAKRTRKPKAAAPAATA